MTKLAKNKLCSRCGTGVPMSTRAGDRCPACGAVFSTEQNAPAAPPASASPGVGLGSGPASSSLLLALAVTAVYLLVMGLTLIPELGLNWGRVYVLVPFIVIAGKAGLQWSRRPSWPYLLLIAAFGSFGLSAAIWLMSSRFYFSAGVAQWTDAIGTLLFTAGYLAWAVQKPTAPGETDLAPVASALAVMTAGGLSLIIHLAARSLVPESRFLLGKLFWALTDMVIIAAAGARVIKFRRGPDFLQLFGAGGRLIVFVGFGFAMAPLRLIWPNLEPMKVYSFYLPVFSLTTFILALGFLLADHGPAPADSTGAWPQPAESP
jgi:hypothetical protein